MYVTFNSIKIKRIMDFESGLDGGVVIVAGLLITFLIASGLVFNGRLYVCFCDVLDQFVKAFNQLP